MLKLKKFKNLASKKFELHGVADDALKESLINKAEQTIGEKLRDGIIANAVKTAEESAYAAGNMTEKVVTLADKAGVTIDRATELGFGTESAGALGRITFKATKDLARGDSVCTGLCLISGTCEAVALCCSTVKIIPCRGKIYVGAKIVSKGCIAFRNACAGEGC